MPLDEDRPKRPVNAYGETKLAVERSLPHLERAAGIRWTALRYFNAAGADPDGWIGEAHDPEEHLIPRAIAAARGGPTLTVFGDDYPTPDGTCIRDYIHVEDLIDAHAHVMQHLKPGFHTYNLGIGHGYSVKQIIDAAREVVDRQFKVELGPRRPGDPPSLYADATKIRTELGWEAKRTDIKAIIASAWRWFQAHPDGYR